MENLDKNSETTVQQVAHPLGSHSLKDTMAKLAIGSKSTVTARKNMVKVAFKLDLQRVINSDQTLTDEGLEQVRLAGRFAKKKAKLDYYKAVWQANPELEYSLASTPVNPVPGQDDQQAGQVGQPSCSTNFDPFAGVNSSTAITRREITALDLSDSSRRRSQQSNEAIANAQRFTQQLFTQIVSTQSSIGVELGEMMAQKIINDAEDAKQEKLSDYARSQGAAVKKQEDGSSPQSA